MAGEKENISHPVTISEAFHLLEPLRGRFKNTRSTSFKIYKETLQYAEKFGKIKDKALLADLKESLVGLGFTEEEAASLGSLFPQSTGDAKLCVPSISRLPDSTIDLAIEKMQLLP